MKKIKLIVIVGPTASGKTKLAVQLAKKYHGEIISADSMQIYQKMNIATAKPTLEEMEGIPHHLIDFLPMNAQFSVSDFVSLARQKIEQIHQSGKLPIVAGGTGLYINSLVDNVAFSCVEEDPSLRNQLYEQVQQDQGAALYAYLKQIDPESALEIHQNNFVRLVRAVEIYQLTGITMSEHKKNSKLVPSPYEVCMIGLNYQDREKLYQRINQRVDIMMEMGLLEEARQILKEDDLKTAYHAIGYKELKPYFAGELSLDEAVDKIKQSSRRYAKRQLTWFRRDKRIHWIYLDKFGSYEEVVTKSENILENFIDL